LLIAKNEPEWTRVCSIGGDFMYWTAVETTESGQRIRAGTHKEDPLTALTQRLRALVTKSFAQTRQAPRFAFTDSLEVRTASGAVFRGIARDLSRRGLGAIICADLQVGDSVVIKYAHPQPPADRQIVVRHARVRGRYGSRYGFEFEHAMDIP
jgi:PilZ domain